MRKLEPPIHGIQTSAGSDFKPNKVQVNIYETTKAAPGVAEV